MSQEWQQQLPDWLAPAAAWVASVVAAGGAKPAFDWWRQRSKDHREAKRDEIDAATELREELRKTVREMNTDLRELRAVVDKRDNEIGALRREMYELIGKIAALTAENHEVRAEKHRIKNWITGFYGNLQIRWKLAGLPMDDFPSLPPWITQSAPGPTASFQDQAGES